MAEKATAAATAIASSAPDVEPEIKPNSYAQEEADRLNIFQLTVIGAKESAAAGASAVVRTAVTDATLCTTDGQDFRTVDKYQLVDMIQAVIDRAERPATTDICNLYVQL